MYGYIFLTVYEFVSFKDSSDKKYKLISSVVANYIITLLFSYIGVKHIVAKIIISVLLGYVIAKIICSDKWNNILLNSLHIQRTSNTNIWDDAIKEGYGVEIFEKNSNISYYGICKYIEPFERNPIIVLSRYQILENGNLTNDENDFSDDTTKNIVLNLKDFEKVKIYK